jgi:bacillithiol biosynthesis cysteine-adding enzyme BshC
MSDSFFSSFLAGEERAESLLPARFRNRQERIAAVRRASQRPVSSDLMEVLRSQDQSLPPPSDARRQNLDALATSGTAAVITGQQVGLFLGPLFTFYKAASAIALARALEKESGIRCVPIFWLQTEDHDFPEISHCQILCADGTRTRLSLEDAPPPAEQRISIEYRVLDELSARLVDLLEECLGKLPHAQEFIPLIRAHYRPGQSMPAAFAGLVASLFAEEGLIVFDPRNQAVSKLAAPVYRRALIDRDAIAASLLQRTEALERAGFAAQVYVRAASPLFFFHPRGAEGERFRLQAENRAWSLVGSEDSVSTGELLSLMDKEPLRFSSSALLRPILQDQLFPTAAYVGGPAEVSYFAQLPPIYELFQLPVPLVVPRARFRCIEPKTRSLLERLRLVPSEAETLTTPPGPTGDQPAADYPPAEVVNDRLMLEFSRQLDDFQRTAQALDPSLIKAVDLTRGTVAHAVSRLTAKYQRALSEKDQVGRQRLDKLRSLLCPEGVPQERYDSFPYFACHYGLEEFKAKIFASLDPFAAEVRDIEL